MSKEQAEEILAKIQAGTATQIEKNQARLAFSVVTGTILRKPGV